MTIEGNADKPKLSRKQRAELKREAREQELNSNEQASTTVETPIQSDDVSSVDGDSVIDVGVGINGKAIPEPTIRDRIAASVNTGKADSRKTEHTQPRHKFDSRKRARQATEVAPFIDKMLLMYAMKAHRVPVDPTLMQVPYWYQKGVDGSVSWMNGTPGQAIAFHTLGAANATVDRIDLFIDKHRDAIGVLIACLFVGYFELHCRGVAAMLAQASKEASEAQQSAASTPPEQPVESSGRTVWVNPDGTSTEVEP